MRRFCNFVITTVALFIPATTVSAAAPHIIIFHGSRLPAQVVLANWEENHRLMDSLSADQIVKPEELSSREYVEVALFWGPQWLDYKAREGSLATLTPEQANQKARLYLAHGDAAPLLAFEGKPPRYLGPDGVRLLVQHGVPVRVETQQQSHLVWWVVVIAGLAISLAGAVVLLMRNGRQPLVVESVGRNH